MAAFPTAHMPTLNGTALEGTPSKEQPVLQSVAMGSKLGLKIVMLGRNEDVLLIVLKWKLGTLVMEQLQMYVPQYAATEGSFLLSFAMMES